MATRIVWPRRTATKRRSPEPIELAQDLPPVLAVGAHLKNTVCVTVCPVDCFHEDETALWIDPEECIDCGACEPECPWEAIYEDASVPEVLTEDTALNAKMMEDQDSFEVPVNEGTDQPTPDQVTENKAKWNLTA